MAYDLLPGDDVDGWDNDYGAKTAELANEHDPLERARLTTELVELAEETEDRLALDMRKMRASFAIHMRNINGWVASAAREQKTARSLAAKFKRRSGQPAQVAQLKARIQAIADLEQAMFDDGQDFGASWFDYRTITFKHIPKQYLAKFLAVRTQTMNESKIINVQRQKLVAARREAKAYLALTDKAADKRAVKQDPQSGRSMTDAQALASAVEAQMAKILRELRQPKSMASAPYTIDTNASSLEGQVTNPQWVVVPNNLTLSRGFLKNVEATYKLMQTQFVNMEKILATKKRGFRTLELKDVTVKRHLADALLRIGEAKQELVTYTPGLKRAKKAMAKIEANFKTAAKKKK